MIGWMFILFGIIVIIVVSKFLHFHHLKSKIIAVVLIVVLIFITSTFMSVIKNNSVDFKSVSGIINVVKIYFVWLGQAFGNIKVLTANVVKMDWIPQNMSFTG